VSRDLGIVTVIGLLLATACSGTSHRPPAPGPSPASTQAGTTAPSTAPASTSPSTALTSGSTAPASAGCATSSNANGSLTVCPDAGPVATSVALRGQGCNNPGEPVTAVFLGPGTYVGSSGGGDEFMIPVNSSNQFNGSFQIPPTYTSGGASNHPVPVTPGRFSFSVYPAGLCSVPFTVTG
jgi:hypothetical protein